MQLLLVKRTFYCYIFRLKYESEHLALTEANSQLETQERRVRQLEAAQRIAQQTGADEVCTINLIFNVDSNPILSLFF